MTPYAASKIVNATLVANDLPPVRPQMLYNYTTQRLNQGKTPLIECDRNGVTAAGLDAWLTKYIAKKLNPTTAGNAVFERVYGD